MNDDVSLYGFMVRAIYGMMDFIAAILYAGFRGSSVSNQFRTFIIIVSYPITAIIQVLPILYLIFSNNIMKKIRFVLCRLYIVVTLIINSIAGFIALIGG